MMRSFALALLGVALVAPAASAAPRLGTPETVVSLLGDASYVSSAVSHDGSAPAFAVSRRVVFTTAAGEVRTFPAPSASGAIRIVPLEDGGGIALWPDQAGGRVVARRWTTDGTLGEERTVLSGVAPIGYGDNEYTAWTYGYSDDGTVTVAAPDAHGSLTAVRRPGEDFGPQQDAVGPVPGPGTEELGPTARTGYGVDGQTFTITPALAKLCPCRAPRLLRWSTGERVLVFARFTPGKYAASVWYVARPDAAGAFDRADRATSAYGIPFERARPGEVGFASVDQTLDAPRANGMSRVVVAPFGTQVARSTRAPLVQLDRLAQSVGHRLLVGFACDRVCTPDAVAGGAAVRVSGDHGQRAAHQADPFAVAELRITVGTSQARVRLRLRVADDAGHATFVAASFRRRPKPIPGGARLWCRVGTVGC